VNVLPTADIQRHKHFTFPNKIMKKTITLSLLSCGCALTSYAANYVITGTQASLAGAQTNVTDGTTTDFGTGADLATVGNFAVFDVGVGTLASNTPFGQLRVTYSANLGNIADNRVFVARTTNSQGLTDAGTFTVLIQSTAGGVGTAQLQLDWLTPGSYIGRTLQGGAAPLNPIVNFTTFDIDFRQQVTIQRGGLTTYRTASNTNLTVTENIPANRVTFSDAVPTDTVVTDPTSAFAFTTVASSGLTLELGRTNAVAAYSLFMFEMRDPSTNVALNGPPVVIPEPSVFASLIGSAALLVAARRRRVKA
jgi:hypothetical protein